jgi:hypothetical protein
MPRVAAGPLRCSMAPLHHCIGARRGSRGWRPLQPPRAFCKWSSVIRRGGGSPPPRPSGVVLWGSLAPLLYINPFCSLFTNPIVAYFDTVLLIVFVVEMAIWPSKLPPLALYLA